LQTDDLIQMKAMDVYKNYQGTTNWSQPAKSPRANQVARKWTMKYSYATRIDFAPNPDACGDFGVPTLEFQVDGYGLASHMGNFTFINRACFELDDKGIPTRPLEALRGVGTTAAGDQWYFVRESSDEDPPGSGYFLQKWKVTGGSEGGRFEYASGELYLYGNPDLPEEPFVGWGEFVY
jgi:hypothetical protein